MLFELKVSGKELDTGQRLALERAVDDWARAGKKAIGIVADHDTTPEQDIDAAICQPVRFRWNGEWRDCPQGHTLRWFIDRWLREVGLQAYIGAQHG